MAAKAAAALRNELTPIVCIGEHLEVREAGNHVSHNVEQLRGSLAGLSAEQIGQVVIAYEPVWAIGTGRVASASDAQEVCAAIRKELGSLASPQIADTVRVLYGGSVNAKNVGDIVAQTGRRRWLGRRGVAGRGTVCDVGGHRRRRAAALTLVLRSRVASHRSSARAHHILARIMSSGSTTARNSDTAITPTVMPTPL